MRSSEGTAIYPDPRRQQDAHELCLQILQNVEREAAGQENPVSSTFTFEVGRCGLMFVILL